MKYGFVLPYLDGELAVEYAVLAEEHGWDGFFVCEPVWGADAWVSLTAAAMRTSRIRLGTMLTPVSRRRPWKLAGETATLDRLSAGRVILAVGLGAPDSGFDSFGEVTDRRTRAELLDEGLEIVTGLWRAEPFSFDGKHYRVRPLEHMPPALPPVQAPIPIWVVGALGSRKSMARAARYQGLIPQVVDGGSARGARPDEIRALAWPGEIVAEGGNAAEWAAAGATWWIQAPWTAGSEEEVRALVLAGPPR